VLAIAAVVLVGTGLLARLDDLMLDHVARLRPFEGASNVLLVEVDGRSMERLGRWPWTRAFHASLVERATSAGAVAIGFDIAFPDADPIDPAADRMFAAAIAASGRVVLPAFSERDGAGRLHETRPIDVLAAGATLGNVEVDIDPDGHIRRVPMPRTVDAAAVVPFAIALGQAGRDAGDAAAFLAPRIFADASEVLVPFAAMPRAFPRVSYADLLDDPAVLERVRGKRLLAGVTAPGLARTFMVAAPRGARTISGAELQARIVDAVDRGALVHPAALALVAAVTFAACVLALGQFMLTATPAALVAFFSGGCLLFIVGSAMLFHLARIWISPVVPCTLLLVGQAAWWWWHLQSLAHARDRYRSRFEAAMQWSSDVIVTTDAHGRIVDANHTALRLLGRDGQSATGASLVALLEPGGGAASTAIWKAIAECMAREEVVRPDGVIALAEPGQDRSFRLTATPIARPEAGAARVVVVLHDVTSTRALADSVTYLANHDVLTGLPNRQTFMRVLGESLGAAGGTDVELAIVALELDGFQRIEQAFGPSTGDRVLREVACRLEALRRPGDALSHGERGVFWMLIRGSTFAGSATDRVKIVLAGFADPVLVDQREFRLSACAGVARYPVEGDEAETLLRKASAALGRIRDGGGGAVDIYSADHDARDRGELELQLELARAIERDELVLHYQPQVSIATGRVVGFEALVRWNHPRLGLIGADRVVPAAEATDLILSVGEWVMHTAAWQLASWRRAGLTGITMSVNVSARQLWRADMIELARRVVQDFALERGAMLLELTESLLMRNPESCEAILEEARRQGVGVSIDDFGTGYSSLTHLRNLPVDQLKIDQSFIRELPADSGSAAIVEAVIAMAHSLGVSVVAEGVETAEQRQWLRNKGCDKMHGHYFGRRVPAIEVPDLVTEIQSRRGI